MLMQSEKIALWYGPSLVQHSALPHAVLISLVLFWHYTVSVIFMDGPFREVQL